MEGHLMAGFRDAPDEEVDRWHGLYIEEWADEIARLKYELERMRGERDMYAHRCLELVKQHDYQRDEIEHLRARVRGKHAGGRSSA
jgi:uncharacterized small protein (DUF1192 family)